MKTQTVSTSAKALEEAKRLPYVSPSLKAYGQLRDLTDGGSGPIIEGNMMTAPNRMV